MDRGGRKETHCDRVRAKLIPKTGEEVQELEPCHAGPRFGECFIHYGWDEEADEVAEESDSLHRLSAIEFIVDERSSHVVSYKGTTDVDQVVEPAAHDARAVRFNDLDELGLKNLVAVEEEVVTEPTARSSDEPRPVVAQRKLERARVVSGRVQMPLRRRERRVGVSDLVVPWKGLVSGALLRVMKGAYAANRDCKLPIENNVKPSTKRPMPVMQ